MARFLFFFNNEWTYGDFGFSLNPTSAWTTVKIDNDIIAHHSNLGYPVGICVSRTDMAIMYNESIIVPQIFNFKELWVQYISTAAISGLIRIIYKAHAS